MDKCADLSLTVHYIYWQLFVIVFKSSISILNLPENVSVMLLLQFVFITSLVLLEESDILPFSCQDKGTFSADSSAGCDELLSVLEEIKLLVKMN